MLAIACNIVSSSTESSSSTSWSAGQGSSKRGRFFVDSGGVSGAPLPSFGGVIYNVGRLER